jgi:anti-sigma factor RsiW
MSNHLSADQFESCVLDRAGRSELEHISECPECSAEVERFRNGLTVFRRAVRDIAGETASFEKAQAASMRVPGWRWTLAAATLIAAIVLPLLVSRPQPIASVPPETSPEALMERLNRHLSGTVPEAMEPALSLISFEPPAVEREGVQ